jgi:hypothetical protein
MAFYWYQPVYIKHYKSTSANISFPSESQEKIGRIVGIAEHKGDSLTFLMLDSFTTQVVTRSKLRSGLDSTTRNFRTIMSPDGSAPDSKKIIKSHTDAIDFKIPTSSLKLPHISPDELIGKAFVCTLDDGKSYCATVVRIIQDHDAENHARINFLDDIGDGAFNEILAYRTLRECIEDIEDEYLTS